MSQTRNPECSTSRDTSRAAGIESSESGSLEVMSRLKASSVYLVAQVVAGRGGRLRWVLIEESPLDLHFHGKRFTASSNMIT